tara:strand:- start:195 stop:602 length:408 start_codon:yes stop_codon:yes gene_type:complete
MFVSGVNLNNSRVNLAISGWTCIVVGSGIILSSGPSSIILAIAAPIAISGIGLLMAAIGMSQDDGVDPETVHAWTPETDFLPDAGGPMFRVDTTLIPPVRTSVLCGRCGNLEMLNGPKPIKYICQECEIILWEEE